MGAALVAALSSFVVATESPVQRPTPRIVNGLPGPGLFPTVGIFYRLGDASCSGTLIGCHATTTSP